MQTIISPLWIAGGFLFGTSNSDSPISSAPEIEPVAIDRRSPARVAVAIAIALMVDLVMILWICPITQTIADWAGASWLDSCRMGVIAMVSSAPVVLAGSAVLVARILGMKSAR